MTEATEKQKNLLETQVRLQLECEETSRRQEHVETEITEGNLKIENSQKRILDIDQSFEGMLEDRANIRLELDEGILLHEQKNDEQTVLILSLIHI